MSKIHPAYHHRKLQSKPPVYKNEDDRLPPPPSPPTRLIISRPLANRPSIFTVWKKSSMSFQGTDGFTVFDKQGRLIFRVDNYTRRKNRSIASRDSGLVLMDAHGKPLLTLRPHMRVQLQYEWNGYSGGEDDDGSTNVNNSSSHLFVMRRPPSSLLTMMGTSTATSCQAQVFSAGENNVIDMKRRPDYRVEGSYRLRNCNIINSDGHIVANISRKVANATTTRTTILISDEVFSLVVQPGFEPHIFMAFVIILDRMYPNSYLPLICS